MSVDLKEFENLFHFIDEETKYTRYIYRYRNPEDSNLCYTLKASEVLMKEINEENKEEYLKKINDFLDKKIFFIRSPKWAPGEAVIDCNKFISLDKGIAERVLTLRRRGIETISSCEGYDDAEVSSVPYIKMFLNDEELADLIRIYNNARDTSTRICFEIRNEYSPCYEVKVRISKIAVKEFENTHKDFKGNRKILYDGWINYQLNNLIDNLVAEKMKRDRSR